MLITSSALSLLPMHRCRNFCAFAGCVEWSIPRQIYNTSAKRSVVDDPINFSVCVIVCTYIHMYEHFHYLCSVLRSCINVYVVHWAVTPEVQLDYQLRFVALLVLSHLMEGYHDMD